MRALALMRRSLRMAILKRVAEPDRLKSTTKRKKFTGSYSDIMNLPSAGGATLQDEDGFLIWMMDYDPLP